MAQLFSDIWEIITTAEYRNYLLQGFLNTLILTLFAAIIGLVIGFIVAIIKIFAKDNERALEILHEYCNPSNVFDLINKDKEAIKKYDLIDKEMEELFNKQDKYITENGNELQKETMNLLKDFFINNKSVTKNEYDKNMKELADKLKELNNKSEKNN